jgi:hypothetical protein
MGQRPHREVERGGFNRTRPLKQCAFKRVCLTTASSGLRRSIGTERPISTFVLYKQKLCRSQPRVLTPMLSSAGSFLTQDVVTADAFARQGCM